MPEIEGLPVLVGLTVLKPFDNGMTTEFEAKNQIVGKLTPITEDDTPPHTPADDYAALLGMPLEDAIGLWQSAGAPIIHLGSGENCNDLEKLLSNSDVKREHLEAVKCWLDSVRAKS
jgi:hypothetical protein